MKFLEIKVKSGVRCRAGRGCVAMERDGDQLSAPPALKTQGLRFLHVTVGSLPAT